jgi:hypothetical protein
MMSKVAHHKQMPWQHLLSPAARSSSSIWGGLRCVSCRTSNMAETGRRARVCKWGEASKGLKRWIANLICFFLRRHCSRDRWNASDPHCVGRRLGFLE